MAFRHSSSSSSSSSSDGLDELGYEIMDEIINNHFTNQQTPTQPRRRKRVIERNREEGHLRLYNDYFAPNPTYPPNIFRRRFRMRKELFVRIMDAVSTSDQYFQQRPNATGRLGLSTLQKCSAAIRMLAYGVAADCTDEYLRIGESTAQLCLKKFTEGVISNFGAEYLRRPNLQDIQRILHINKERGFPGMIGSIDCMHWEWKNCPAAWKAQYQGRSGTATLILEAVASQDLWIWHAFFGIPGSCNDLNVLYRSPVFDDVLNGHAPPAEFAVNGRRYKMCYYLTDGIYPDWAAFIQGIKHPQTEKHRLFAERQAAVRKDVERAFGVLQARFAIIRRPSLAWDEDALRNIMMACIIMHNMIVEDERDTYQGYTDPTEFIEDQPQRRPRQRRRETNGGPSAPVDEDEGSFNYQVERPFNMNHYLGRRDELRDRQTHYRLKDDLIEHIWRINRRNDNPN